MFVWMNILIFTVWIANLYIGTSCDPCLLVGSTWTNISILGKCNTEFSIIVDYIYELEINSTKSVCNYFHLSMHVLLRCKNPPRVSLIGLTCHVEIILAKELTNSNPPQSLEVKHICSMSTTFTLCHSWNVRNPRESFPWKKTYQDTFY